MTRTLRRTSTPVSNDSRVTFSAPLPNPVATAVAFALLALNAAGMRNVDAAPTGGQVTAGAATINQSGAKTVINQSTPRAALNWQSFSIGSAESVIFQQPSSSAVALNRVVGPNPSAIYGTLQANGHVFLINPSGVLFGRGANVDVAGLVASTLNISNNDFMAGRLVFSGGAGAGAVVNHGSIRAASGGYVALLGNQVNNTGTIVAANGSVALGAGDSMLLDFNGDGLLNLRVNAAAASARIDHSGEIHADGGAVIMSAQAKNALLSTVLNVEGIVTAKGVVERDGHIYLDGGRSGVTAVYGTLDATSAIAKGGEIRVLGENVGLFGNARLDASGASGGGTVLVGGDFQGSNPGIANAARTYVGPDATITADAINEGGGGKVIVWADDITRFHGKVSARGGAQGGDGGFAEVSGKGTLIYDGIVNLTAPRGDTGTLLLDPTDSTISNAGTDSAGDVAAFGNATCGAGNNATACSISPASLNAAGANVVLQTQNDLTISDAVSLTTTANASFTAQAGRTITVSAPVSTNGSGRITLVANNTANGETDAANAALTGSGGTNRSAGAGHLIVNAAISSGTGAIKLVSSGAATNGGEAGDVQLGANVTTAGNVTIAANGGAITRSAGTLTGNLVTLNAASGIGSAGGANAVFTSASSLAASNTTSGDIVISEANAVTLAGTSSSGDFHLSAGGGIEARTGAASGFTDTVINAAGNISLTATGTGPNITIYNHIRRNNTTPGTLRITADGDVNFAAGFGADVIATGAPLAVTLNADRNSNGGWIGLNNGTVINSNGGDITFHGGTSTAMPAAGDSSIRRGIVVDGAQVLSGAGNIFMRGRGFSGAGVNNDDGVDIRGGAVVQSTTGSITMVGTGGAAQDTSVGIRVTGAGTTITSADGPISLTGTGGASTGTGNSGVRVSAEALVSTSGTGNIGMTGTGGAGTTNQRGIEVVTGGKVTSTSSAANAGTIAMTGTGGAGGTGIQVSAETTPGTTISSVLGNISLTGTGGSATSVDNIDGLDIRTGAVVQSTTGSITLAGTGGAGRDTSVGIRVTGAGTMITSPDGNISLTGTGGAATGTGNSGVRVSGEAVVSTSGTGNISITGTGGAGTTNQRGIEVVTGGKVVSTSSAANAGTITMTGTGGAGSDGRTGITVSAETTPGTTVSSFLGNISLTGIGGGAGNSNFGVSLNTGSTVASRGAANIAITGTGTGGAADITTFAGGNNIGGANMTGDVLLRAMTGGGMTFDAAIRNNGAKVTLNAVGGGPVTQTAGSSITTGGLRLLGGGAFTLDQAANNVATLAGNTGGGVSYTNAGGFNVGSVNTDSDANGTLDGPTIGMTAGGGIALTASTGNIGLAANVATAGGSIALTGPIVLANNVVVDATNAGGAPTGNSVSFTSTLNADSAANNRTLTVAAGTGDITFAGAVGTTRLGLFQIDSARNVTANAGITAGSVNVSATGASTFGALDTSSAAGIALNSGVLNLNGAVTTNGAGPVTLVANTLQIGATLTAAGQAVTIRPQDASRSINVGTEAAGSLSLADSELDRITAGSLTLGSAGTTGAIGITADSGPANAPNVTLINNTGGIDIGGNFTATGNLTLTANGGGANQGAIRRSAGTVTGNVVTLNAATGIGSAGGASAVVTSANTLVASNTAAGNIALSETDSVNVGPVSGSGDFALTNGTGNITTAGVMNVAGNIAFTGRNAITIGHDINRNNASPGTLQIIADGTILFTNGADVTATGGPLAITLNADRNMANGGAINLNIGNVINSNGGDITLHGGTSTTMPAIGANSTPFSDGVRLDGAQLISGAGNIVIRGRGFAGAGLNNNDGVTLTGASIVQSTSGSITIEGTGGAAQDGNRGVNIFGAGTQVTSAGGSISITGMGAGTGADNVGVVTRSGALVSTTGAGGIALTGAGAAGAADIVLDLGGGNLGGATMTGNILLSGMTAAGTRLDSDATIVTNGGNVTFAGAVQSPGTPRTLRVNTSGATAFTGAIGGSGNPLSSLVTDTGGTTVINTTGINTTGNQTFGDAVAVGANATLASTGGNITFSTTLDADLAANSRVLAVTAPLGTVTFSGNVGAIQAFAGLNVTASPNTIVFNAPGAQVVNVSAGGGGNAVTFTGSVRLDQSLTVNTASADNATSNNVVFNGAVNAGAGSSPTLNVTAGTGNVALAAAGDQQELAGLTVAAREVTLTGNITVNGGGAVDFRNVTALVLAAPITIATDTAGGTSAAGAILLNPATAITAAPGASAALTLNASADGGGTSGNVVLAAPGGVQLSATGRILNPPPEPPPNFDNPLRAVLDQRTGPEDTGTDPQGRPLASGLGADAVTGAPRAAVSGPATCTPSNASTLSCD